MWFNRVIPNNSVPPILRYKFYYSHVLLTIPLKIRTRRGLVPVPDPHFCIHVCYDQTKPTLSTHEECSGLEIGTIVVINRYPLQKASRNRQTEFSDLPDYKKGRVYLRRKSPFPSKFAASNLTQGEQLLQKGRAILWQGGEEEEVLVPYLKVQIRLLD